MQFLCMCKAIHTPYFTAIFKDNENRHAHDHILFLQSGKFFNIDFMNGCRISDTIPDFIQHRFQPFTRLAPVGIEINENRFASLQKFIEKMRRIFSIQFHQGSGRLRNFNRNARFLNFRKTAANIENIFKSVCFHHGNSHHRPVPTCAVNVIGA